MLWGVKDTAPYFHNNGAKTLRDAVAHYQRFFNFTEAQDPVGSRSLAGLTLLTGQRRRRHRCIPEASGSEPRLRVVAQWGVAAGSSPVQRLPDCDGGTPIKITFGELPAAWSVVGAGRPHHRSGARPGFWSVAPLGQPLRIAAENGWNAESCRPTTSGS